jgi:hypothetical protein
MRTQITCALADHLIMCDFYTSSFRAGMVLIEYECEIYTGINQNFFSSYEHVINSFSNNQMVYIAFASGKCPQSK